MSYSLRDLNILEFQYIYMAKNFNIAKHKESLAHKNNIAKYSWPQTKIPAPT